MGGFSGVSPSLLPAIDNAVQKHYQNFQQDQDIHPLVKAATHRGLLTGGIPGVLGAAASPEAAPTASAAPMRPIPGPTAARPLAPPESPAQEELLAERERLTKPSLGRNDPLAHTKADTSQSGISQIHSPFARIPLQIADALGSAFFPGVMMNIPGTQLHHNQLVRQNERAVEAGEKTEGALANREHLGAETEELGARAAHEQAEAAALGREKPTNEWVELKDPVTDPAHPELGPQAAFFNKNDPSQGLKYGNATIVAKPVIKEPKEGELPLGERVSQLNQALAGRYQVLHPGGQLPAHYTVPANATQKDFDRIDKLMEAEERATGTKEQQAQTMEMRRQTQALAQAQHATTEANTSYYKHTAELDKLRGPVDTAVSKLGRLQDTLNQHTPQADALVAPELLTVMAGGQGSGLRMNEAEISRIVGGRSVWENLKASMQHWSTDPNAARSITPDQDRQIRALVQTVSDKLLAKQRALDEARRGIVSSDDPHEHRRIYQKAQETVDAIDRGESNSAGGMIRARDPQGKLHEAPAGTPLPAGWKAEK